MTPDKTTDKAIRKIELDRFSNKIALDMGLAIVALAESRHQHIAVEISRLNHTVFLYVDDHLPADKHNWLRRKANVAKRFEESSLPVRRSLQTTPLRFPVFDWLLGIQEPVADASLPQNYNGWRTSP